MSDRHPRSVVLANNLHPTILDLGASADARVTKIYSENLGEFQFTIKQKVALHSTRSERLTLWGELWGKIDVVQKFEYAIRIQFTQGNKIG